MNILDPAIKVNQSLPAPADLLINHFIQRCGIRPYRGADSSETRDSPINPLLVHSPLKGGVVKSCCVHSKKRFPRITSLLSEKTTPGCISAGVNTENFCFLSIMHNFYIA